MGFFDKILGKGGATQAPTHNMVGTVPTSAPNTMTIDMSKHTKNLDRVLINMSKPGKVNMTTHIAQVAFVEDYSGSMSGLFRNGAVQRTVTRLLPIALKFDDNGELESWLFSNGSEKLEPITANNYGNYVKEVMLQARMRMGGTEYAPVLRDVVRFYKNRVSTTPAFIIFVTDGDNWDESETDAIVRELSNYNVFVQFVGIGTDSNFNYLRKLDNLSGRKHDNTGFIAVADMDKLTDEQLYTELLRQYNDWLNSK